MRRPAKTSLAPHLALIAVQSIFATWPIVGKFALRAIPSVGLVGLRIGGASLAFLLIGRLRSGVQRINRRDWLLLIVSSCLGVVLNQWLYVKGLSLTTVINATLLGTTIPVFTLLVGIILGSDRASLTRFVGIAIAAAGVIYLIDPSRAEFSSTTRVGDYLMIANSLCYGTYLAVSKDLMRRYSALTVITWIFVIGSIFTVPVGAVSVSRVSPAQITAGICIAVLYIILIPTVGAYYLNAWALAKVEPSTVAVYVYLQPLIAFALAPLLLRETLSWRALIASVLIFAGVIVVTRGKRTIAVQEIADHPDAFGH